MKLYVAILPLLGACGLAIPIGGSVSSSLGDALSRHGRNSQSRGLQEAKRQEDLPPPCPPEGFLTDNNGAPVPCTLQETQPQTGSNTGGGGGGGGGGGSGGAGRAAQFNQGQSGSGFGSPFDVAPSDNVAPQFNGPSPVNGPPQFNGPPQGGFDGFLPPGNPFEG
ncbi:hypothetical protein QQS21_005228 [Conoideocrella luteorostrata]|uniref:Uncharacterized protein n=1 Tax=Conoideocrella luteorostrata TaxID=1105319 RepID=A0AAJ0CQY0_9HYPO|nr:hypothetical protein QQS21_005228 [Conoideocrella luteorostrata]